MSTFSARLEIAQFETYPSHIRGARPSRDRARLALSGILFILIAIMLYANFSYSAAWTFGVLVGMNLVMEGALLLGFLNKGS